MRNKNGHSEDDTELFVIVGLLSFVFWGCKTTEVWEIKEKEQEKYFCYELIQAPEKYSDFVGMNLWTYLDFHFPAEWIPFANEEGILKCLKNRDFEIRKGYNGKNYADFDGMQSKGFKPQIWATTPTMKETLENLGVDLEGITFR